MTYGSSRPTEAFCQENATIHRFHALTLFLFVFLATCPGCASSWRKQFDAELMRMGHRNWIVVADSAYPAQNRPGITTIYTGHKQLETVQFVLDAIGQSAHVRPIVYRDAELDRVSEQDAPGVESYRRELEKLVGSSAQSLPHMDIIRKLDESAMMFNVLILKTDMTIPYTSVFIQLDCGYWDADREQRLRNAMSSQ